VFASCDPETERPEAFATPFFRPSNEAEEEEFPAHQRDFTSSYMRSDHSTIISHVFQVPSLAQPRMNGAIYSLKAQIGRPS
jgi:hypothetical protein